MAGSPSLKGIKTTSAKPFPAVISLIGVVGTRVLWVNLVFPQFRTFRALVTVYPVTWIITATALAIAYFRMKRVDLKDFFAMPDAE